MPSKTKSPRKKTCITQDEIISIGSTLLKREMEGSKMSPHDEETVRSALNAIKNGSNDHLLTICKIMGSMPTALCDEAIEVLCDVIDVPPFAAEDNLPVTLTSMRTAAFACLHALAQVHLNILTHGGGTSAVLALEKRWKPISNWILHFLHFPDKGGKISTMGRGIIEAIINCKEVHVRLTTGSDELLDIVVKMWTGLDVSPRDALYVVHAHTCFSQLYKCFVMLSTNDPTGTYRTKLAKKIFRQGQEDASKVAKKLIRHIKYPANALSQSICLVEMSLGITYFLATDFEKTTDSFPIASMFYGCLLGSDFVRAISRLITSISEHLLSATVRERPQRADTCNVLNYCVLLIARFINGKKGQSWVALLLDNGFLRDIGRILSVIPRPGSVFEDLLAEIVGSTVPAYLSQRTVVVSAIKAMKDLDVSGDAAKLERSFLRKPWSILTNVVLERTVLNTFYDQQIKDKSGSECDNCSKHEESTKLYNCGGCKVVKYCSKECQERSWRLHKKQCKSFQQIHSVTGQTMSEEEAKFTHLVALTELRRHLPGIAQKLATLGNPSGIPLRDACYQVSLLTVPPVITVYHRDSPPDPPEDSTSFPSSIESEKGDDESMQPKWISICQYWEGRSALTSTVSVPKIVRLYEEGFNYGGVAAEEIEDRNLLLRQPARDERGNELAFDLDDIDRLVMKARKHFRPPRKDDHRSPKTIYDYVEAEVKADPSFMFWIGNRVYEVVLESPGDC